MKPTRCIILMMAIAILVTACALPPFIPPEIPTTVSVSGEAGGAPYEMLITATVDPEDVDVLGGYAWSFGDSHSAETAENEVAHVFPGPAIYHVCVEVTIQTGSYVLGCAWIEVRTDL